MLNLLCKYVSRWSTIVLPKFTNLWVEELLFIKFLRIKDNKPKTCITDLKPVLNGQQSLQKIMTKFTNLQTET